jgi:hypothetical protein
MSAQDLRGGGTKTPLALRISNFFFPYLVHTFFLRWTNVAYCMLRTPSWCSVCCLYALTGTEIAEPWESRGVGVSGGGRRQEWRRGKPCRNIFIYTFIHFSRRALLAAAWIISKSEYKIMIIHICMNTRVNSELSRIPLLSGRYALNAWRIAAR